MRRQHGQEIKEEPHKPRFAEPRSLCLKASEVGTRGITKELPLSDQSVDKTPLALWSLDTLIGHKSDCSPCNLNRKGSSFESDRERNSLSDSSNVTT